MRNISVIIVGLGLIGLVAGCESGVNPIEVRYEKPADIGNVGGTPSEAETGDIVLPSDSGTESSGEVILPEADGPTTVLEAPAAEADSPETAPSEATPPEAPVVETGDGVVDAEPEIGTPPVPPVSCDEPAFAFVSKRAGRQEIYRLRDGAEDRVMENTRDFRSFSHLAFQPGTQVLSYDDDSIIHPLIPVPIMAIMTGDLSDASPSFAPIDADTLVHGLAWNADGTKAAYFSHRLERGKLLTDIQIVGDTGTFTLGRTIKVDQLGTETFGRLAWWGDDLIYDVRFSRLDDSTRKLRIVNASGPARDHPLYVADSGIIFNRNLGSEPAVSPVGNTLAYVERESRLVTCQLHDQEPIFGGLPGFLCRSNHILSSGGKIESPSWSPDGRWIYFVSDRDGNKEIYRIRSDGTDEERLTNNPADDTSPAPFAPAEGCE